MLRENQQPGAKNSLPLSTRVLLGVEQWVDQHSSASVQNDSVFDTKRRLLLAGLGTGIAAAIGGTILVVKNLPENPDRERSRPYLNYKDSTAIPDGILYNGTPGVQLAYDPKSLQRYTDEFGLQLPKNVKVVTTLGPLTGDQQVDKEALAFLKEAEDILTTENYRNLRGPITLLPLKFLMNKLINEELKQRSPSDTNAIHDALSRKISLTWAENMRKYAEQFPVSRLTHSGLREEERRKITDNPPLRVIFVDAGLLQKKGQETVIWLNQQETPVPKDSHLVVENGIVANFTDVGVAINTEEIKKMFANRALNLSFPNLARPTKINTFFGPFFTNNPSTENPTIAGSIAGQINIMDIKTYGTTISPSDYLNINISIFGFIEEMLKANKHLVNLEWLNQRLIQSWAIGIKGSIESRQNGSNKTKIIGPNDVEDIIASFHTPPLRVTHIPEHIVQQVKNKITNDLQTSAR